MIAALYMSIHVLYYTANFLVSAKFNSHPHHYRARSIFLFLVFTIMPQAIQWYIVVTAWLIQCHVYQYSMLQLSMSFCSQMPV